MKLISLNSWGSRLDGIFNFISDNAESTDIFCFQEVLTGGIGKTGRGELKSAYEDLGATLPSHTGYFFQYGEGGYYGESSGGLDFKFGVACFVRDELTQALVGGTTLYDLGQEWTDYSGGFAAGASLAVRVEDYVIVNVHGLWQGGIKQDTEARHEQSKKILELANRFAGKKVITGDFNLLPDTEAIRTFGDAYQDLIKKYGIKDTRGALYTKELRYSDYVFVDKGIVVNIFAVPNVDVSDHLPLVLEFDS